MTLHLDVEMADYHGHESVSHSKLRDFEQLGPKGYYLRHVRGQAPRSDTRALRVGRAFETYLLEPERFQAWFAVKPEDHNGKTNKGKDWIAEQEAAGRVVIDRDDFINFEYMKRAVEECGAAQALLDGCMQQPTWRTEWPGVPGLQARPDLANLHGCPQSDFRGYSMDLKTTRTLDDLSSGRSIVKYAYHSQAALIRLASESPDMAHYLLAVEKAFPCRAVVIEVSRAFVDIGEAWARDQLARLSESYAADHWPLSECDSLIVEPPAWLVARYAANDIGDVDDDTEWQAPTDGDEVREERGW